MTVYLREAHPTDGWVGGNDKVGISIAQPTSFADRCKVADRCCSSLKVTIPMVVDELDDRVGIAYSGMPDRLYLIDSNGRVAYKGGRGPFGYKPPELEQALIMLLTDEAGARPKAPPPRAPERQR